MLRGQRCRPPSLWPRGGARQEVTVTASSSAHDFHHRRGYHDRANGSSHTQQSRKSPRLCLDHRPSGPSNCTSQIILRQSRKGIKGEPLLDLAPPSIQHVPLSPYHGSSHFQQRPPPSSSSPSTSNSLLSSPVVQIAVCYVAPSLRLDVTVGRAYETMTRRRIQRES